MPASHVLDSPARLRGFGRVLSARAGLGAAAAALLLLGSQGLASQQQPPPAAFRTGVDTVAVYASAIDRYGEMVLNLKRGDFEVLDDGKPQPLTLFVNGLQPITAMLLLDTSASMTLNLELAQAAAEQFVIRMLPGDQARVGSFSDRIDLSKSFTSDRDDLLHWVREGVHIGNPTKLWDAVQETMTDLAPFGGRRVIMLLTDGMDTISAAREADVLARAQRDELMVYVVQFRSTFRANLAELPLSPTPGEIFGGDPRFKNPPPTEALRQLARQTGGGHFLLSQNDDVNATFTHVMQELHYQYVLGFTPQKLDGRIHDITVRIDRPNITVRARRNYLAPKAGEERATP